MACDHGAVGLRLDKLAEHSLVTHVLCVVDFGPVVADVTPSPDEPPGILPLLALQAKLR